MSNGGNLPLGDCEEVRTWAITKQAEDRERWHAQDGFNQKREEWEGMSGTRMNKLENRGAYMNAVMMVVGGAITIGVAIVAIAVGLWSR